MVRASFLAAINVKNFFYHPARKKTLLHTSNTIPYRMYLSAGGSIFCCLQPLFSFPHYQYAEIYSSWFLSPVFSHFAFFLFYPFYCLRFPYFLFISYFNFFFLLFFQFLPSNGSSRYLSGRGMEDVFQYIHFPVRQCWWKDLVAEYDILYRTCGG